jgi:hypothetical protein
MLKSYRIDTTKRLASATFAGTMTVEDIEAYAAQLRADRRFSPTYSEIVDLTQVEKSRGKYPAAYDRGG